MLEIRLILSKSKDGEHYAIRLNIKIYMEEGLHSIIKAIGLEK